MFDYLRSPAELHWRPWLVMQRTLLRSSLVDVAGFADKELLLDCTDRTFLLQPADSPAIVERSLANRIAAGQALLTHR